MIRHILTVSSGTLTSRLLGFVRDAMVAALLGAGPVADAFLVAFQFVNVVRRLLSEGALNAALIPAWVRVNGEQGAVAAAAFAGRVLGTVSLAAVVVALLLGVAMPLLIALLAPGFVGLETLQLAVDDIRLMLPYLAFSGPVTVMMALLNAQHRFALTAFSPILFNIALIAVMMALLLRPMDAGDAAFAIAATVGIAGVLQLAMLALSGRGGAVGTPLKVAFDAPMRALFAKVGPGMVASSGPQLLIVAGAIVASRSPAEVSWLYFANRLVELPLGVVGAALGTVLVPEFTRAIRSDDKAALVHAQSRAFELSVGLALPATFGLMVLAQPIVRLLFERGAFTTADTVATAQALMWLALGLPAHVLTKALSPAFFAREDTMTPLIATLCGLGVAVIAALASGSAIGIATAIALGAWASALVLGVRAAATFGLSVDEGAKRSLPRIMLAALVMGVLLWLKARYIWPLTAGAHALGQALALVLLISGGLAVYSVLLALTGVLDLKAILSRLRR